MRKKSNKHGPKRPSSSSETVIGNKGKKPKREVATMKGKLQLSSPETNNKGKKTEEEVENVTVSYYVLPWHLSGVEVKWIKEIDEQVLNGYCFSQQAIELLFSNHSIYFASSR
ncbi:hypothetical protein GQ457_03G026130 [Hibiscus cannabinus]